MRTVVEEIKQTKTFKNDYQEATINLIFTGKWLVKLHNDIFLSYGISLQQYNVLRILNGIEPESATVLYIKERMLDKVSDTSRIVDKMVKNNILIRSQNANDRRKVDVSLSELGKHLLSEIKKEEPILFGFISNLNEEEVMKFNQLLNKIRS